MKRSVIVGVGLAVIILVNLAMFRDRSSTNAVAAAPPNHVQPTVAAGPGLVEPVSEEIRVSAQIGGNLAQVLVDEGDRVTAGQVIAVLDNRDYHARVAAAEAELSLRVAELRRLMNGARTQERQEAAAALAEAEAVLQNAQTEQKRRKNLLADGVVSHAEAEDADRAERVAGARTEAARQRFDLITADPREEDRARARSEVSLTKGRLEEAQAQLDKTYIKAPINGLVLRRHRKAGEAVSILFESPIVTMADDHVRRVRVDVDETDVAGVAIGQQAYVTADAFGDRRFPGRVVRVGQLLGRKNVRTDAPAERVDTKVLETLVELEDGRELPLGLRVQAFIVRK